MDTLNKLENWLASVYKGTPKLRSESKKSIVNLWPVVALVLGALQLIAAYELWHWGHRVNQVANLVNSITQYYGGSNLGVHLNAFYWASLVAVLIDGVILLAAYSGLKKRQKSGWNLLFYGTLLNLVYGVFSAFNNYGGVGSLILQIIVSAIVFYFLFQIRDQYTGAKPQSA
ncbi:MAG: hypothetical protein ABSD10_00630 [Candidatus Saccharimonadales bacterium]|jgi:hypothetical protein